MSPICVHEAVQILPGTARKQASLVEILSDEDLYWWFSTGDKTAPHPYPSPPETLGNVQRYFWLSQLWRERYWHVVVRGQGCR